MIKTLLLTMRQLAKLTLLIGLLLSPITQAADINLVINIIECESSGRHDVYGDDGISYGIAQFREETFYRFAKKAGFKRMYYKNPIHQLRVMNWALDNGYASHWTCYNKVTHKISK